ncbi:SpoIIE family protein phosphatase [Streptomyces mirabilis]|uniref:SpoIIE family protein phosphatase n=1 Tax=Streptomyces mirabilis TaxID=68239 RepID=UPI00367A790D
MAEGADTRIPLRIDSGPTSCAAAEPTLRCRPTDGNGRLGRHWCDVIPLPGARIGLVVGDAGAHGSATAETVGTLRTAARVLADIDLPPDELLTQLSGIVTHMPAVPGRSPDTVSGDASITCLYAVYDPAAGTCSMARAGHPAPVLLRPDGTGGVVDMPAGSPLGLGDPPFEAVEMVVPEGSLLALLTKGLSAAADPGEITDELRRALTRSASALDTLREGVPRTPNPARSGDDRALLLRTHILGADHVADWDVPVEPAAVSEARRRATARLVSWGLEHLVPVTELVVSELVTNAVRHATGPIRLRLIRHETLLCEVSDGSRVGPHPRHARVQDEGGRGLFMVAELTRRWGTRHTRTGKTIWAEQPLREG